MIAALFVVVAAVVVGAYVGYPLFAREEPVDGAATERHELRLRQTRLASDLSDLDTDRAVEKIAKEDYEERREALLRESESVARMLTGNPESDRATLPAVAEEPAALAEKLISERRAALRSLQQGQCRKCGQENPAEARFCMSCGTELFVRGETGR